ncbi:hypothetical protein [Leptospira bandrabouensis]|uniref:hypothetical protein n=1 Tax=Leptospira bandrabouensis TaxID=2484903 RepID=UPI001EE9AEDB|nr:hypothetical protein [Leptospira bandrabouensis]MCG6144042.1 hypothetical protein [Leptospira bandrabouensis]MCG6150917.1 hypothetical protein [Leptospira bandrabouensis]MCG6159703.1 hypothetical protein [Leptospira bandrabouensis]MCG6163636.1 hypothetical protein [Leptospira bandrabouensis]
MSRGNSGRIVLEINPALKDKLYLALANEKLTLKDWFLEQCNAYLDNVNQPKLSFGKVSKNTHSYRKDK